MGNWTSTEEDAEENDAGPVSVETSVPEEDDSMYGTGEVWACRSNQYIRQCDCCPELATDVEARIVRRITTGWGRTTEFNLTSVRNVPPGRSRRAADRFYVLHEPTHLRRLLVTNGRVPLLFYFHGKQGSAWDSALDETHWRKMSHEHGFVVVFGQAEGPIFQHGVRVPPQDIAVSGAFWKSVYGDADLSYVQDVLFDVTTRALPSCVDSARVYAVGFSSGGLFMYPLAVRFGGIRFAAICNYMGGVQWDSRDPNAIPPANEKRETCPILVMTGTEDAHRQHCEKCREMLSGAGYSVRFELLQNRRHEYIPDEIEPMMWSFLSRHRLDSPGVVVDVD